MWSGLFTGNLGRGGGGLALSLSIWDPPKLAKAVVVSLPEIIR